VTSDEQLRLIVYGPCEHCGAVRDVERVEITRMCDPVPTYLVSLACPACGARTSTT